MSQDQIIIFQSTHQALKAEKTLKRANLKCKMIPLPRKFSSNCGLALKIDLAIKPQIEAVLIDNSIEYQAIYDMD